jgi:hypothetical protein
MEHLLPFYVNCVEKKRLEGTVLCTWSSYCVLVYIIYQETIIALKIQNGGLALQEL